MINHKQKSLETQLQQELTKRKRAKRRRVREGGGGGAQKKGEKTIELGNCDAHIDQSTSGGCCCKIYKQYDNHLAINSTTGGQQGGGWRAGGMPG